MEGQVRMELVDQTMDIFLKGQEWNQSIKFYQV